MNKNLLPFICVLSLGCKSWSNTGSNSNTGDTGNILTGGGSKPSKGTEPEKIAEELEKQQAQEMRKKALLTKYGSLFSDQSYKEIFENFVNKITDPEKLEAIERHLPSIKKGSLEYMFCPLYQNFSKSIVDLPKDLFECIVSNLAASDNGYETLNVQVKLCKIFSETNLPLLSNIYSKSPEFTKALIKNNAWSSNYSGDVLFPSLEMLNLYTSLPADKLNALAKSTQRLPYNDESKSAIEEIIKLDNKKIEFLAESGLPFGDKNIEPKFFSWYSGINLDRFRRIAKVKNGDLSLLKFIHMNSIQPNAKIKSDPTVYDKLTKICSMRPEVLSALNDAMLYYDYTKFNNFFDSLSDERVDAMDTLMPDAITNLMEALHYYSETENSFKNLTSDKIKILGSMEEEARRAMIMLDPKLEFSSKKRDFIARKADCLSLNTYFKQCEDAEILNPNVLLQLIRTSDEQIEFLEKLSDEEIQKLLYKRNLNLSRNVINYLNGKTVKDRKEHIMSL